METYWEFGILMAYPFNFWIVRFRNYPFQKMELHGFIHKLYELMV